MLVKPTKITKLITPTTSAALTKPTKATNHLGDAINKFFLPVAVAASSFLFGLIYGLICPAVQPSPSNAESTTSAKSTTATSSTSVSTTSSPITISSDSVISISTPTAVNLNITPDFANSVFTTAEATVSVSTNNAYGYTLSMGTSGKISSNSETSSGTDSGTSSGTDSDSSSMTGSGSSSSSTTSSTTTSLIHDKGSYTIPTLSSETAASTFSSTTDTTTNNMWGYTLDNTTYYPLTTTDNATVIKTTDTTASNDTTTVTFGVKTTSDQPAGDYSNTVVFTAVATPDPDDQVSTDDLLFWGSANNPLNTSTTLVDKSGSGNDGALYNFDGTTSSGYSGTDLVFDGVDDYVNIGLAGYDFENSFSLVAYFGLLSANSYAEEQIISNTQNSGFSLEIDPAQLLIRLASYDGDQYIHAAASETVDLGAFYLVVATYDGSTSRVYINGTLSASSDAEQITISSEPILLGANPYNGIADNDYINMALKEALIYDRTLTADEVQAITTTLQQKYQ